MMFDDDIFKEKLLKEIEEIVKKEQLATAEEMNALKEKVKTLVDSWERELSQLEKELEQIKRLEMILENKEMEGIHKKLRRGVTSTDSFKLPILESLYELGGQAHKSEVLKKIKEKIGDSLTEKDKETTSNGKMRWENRVDLCKYYLVYEGLIENYYFRGVWKLSPEGYKFVEAQHKNQQNI